MSRTVVLAGRSIQDAEIAKHYNSKLCLAVMVGLYQITSNTQLIIMRFCLCFLLTKEILTIRSDVSWWFSANYLCHSVWPQHLQLRTKMETKQWDFYSMECSVWECFHNFGHYLSLWLCTGSHRQLRDVYKTKLLHHCSIDIGAMYTSNNRTH